MNAVGLALCVLCLWGLFAIEAGAQPLLGNIDWKYNRSWAGMEKTDRFVRGYNLTMAHDLNKKIKIGGTGQFIESGANRQSASSYRITPFLEATEFKSKYKWSLGIQQFQSGTDEGNQRLDRNFTSTLALVMPRYLPALSFSSRVAQNFDLSKKSSESKEWQMNSAYQFRDVSLRYAFQTRSFDNLAARRTTDETSRSLLLDYHYDRGLLLMPNSNLFLKYNFSNANFSSSSSSRSTRHYLNSAFNAAVLPRLTMSNTTGYITGGGSGGGRSRQLENAFSLQGAVVENVRWTGNFNQVRLNMGQPSAQKNNDYGATLALDPLPAVNLRLDASRGARYDGPNAKTKSTQTRGFNHLLNAVLYEDILSLSVKYGESASRDYRQKSSSRGKLLENKMHYIFSRDIVFDLDNRVTKQGGGAAETLRREYGLGGTVSGRKIPLTLNGVVRSSKDIGRRSFGEYMEARLNLGNFLMTTANFDNTSERSIAGKTTARSFRVAVVSVLLFSLTRKLQIASTLSLSDIVKNNAGSLKVEIRSKAVDKTRLTVSYALDHQPGARDSNQLNGAYNLWF